MLSRAKVVAAIELVGSIGMAIMMVLIFMGVVARYVLRASIPWTEEGALFLLVWVSFLGGAIAAARGEQMVVDLVEHLLPTASSPWIHRLREVSGLFFGLFLIVASRPFLEATLATRSNVIGIPIGWVILAMPVSAFLIVVFSLWRLYDSVRGTRPGNA